MIKVTPLSQVSNPFSKGKKQSFYDENDIMDRNVVNLLVTIVSFSLMSAVYYVSMSKDVKLLTRLSWGHRTSFIGFCSELDIFVTFQSCAGYPDCSYCMAGGIFALLSHALSLLTYFGAIFAIIRQLIWPSNFEYDEKRRLHLSTSIISSVIGILAYYMMCTPFVQIQKPGGLVFMSFFSIALSFFQYQFLRKRRVDPLASRRIAPASMSVSVPPVSRSRSGTMLEEEENKSDDYEPGNRTRVINVRPPNHVAPL
jgi:hypothetical protein